MKKTMTLIAIVFCLNTKAQYVTIPDANFVTWLQTNVPSAMTGNQMDTTNSVVTSLDSVNVNNQNIADITGIQYFDSLKYFNCDANMTLSFLPRLPNKLKFLACGTNQLTSLPTLPNSLVHLECDYNSVTVFPTLPNALVYFSCIQNGLTSLPTLPNSIQTIYCCQNGSLSSLPSLPSSLLYLNANFSALTILPTLPNTLTYLDVLNNKLLSLPALPNSLTYLDCRQNFRLLNLPTLPNALQYLYCNWDSLSSLPPLPSTLIELTCGDNQLTSLPSLPNSLTTLSCGDNHLTSLPSLPNSLQFFACPTNNISCFPTLPNSINYIAIMQNPYNCLPNYTAGMDSALLATPLCASGNSIGCPISSSCSPGVYFTLSTNTLTLHSYNAVPFYSPNVTTATWHWGDGTSTAGLYPSHSYSAAGAYNVCVTAFSSCGDSAVYCRYDSLSRMSSSSSMVYINVINNVNGINENLNKIIQLNIYPNPTSDQFFIDVNTTAKLNVDLFDVNGRHVFNASVSDKENINVATLENGAYTLRIKTADHVINKKLVILR